MTAVTDVAYGRRGGRWANTVAPRPPRYRGPLCQFCQRPAPAKDAVSCGRLDCRAHASWSEAMWAGAGRMAGSRRRCGLPLSPLDVEALQRHGAPL